MKTISFVASLLLVATTVEAIEINADAEMWGGSDSFFGDFKFGNHASFGGGMLHNIMRNGGSGNLQ